MVVVREVIEFLIWLIIVLAGFVMGYVFMELVSWL